MQRTWQMVITNMPWLLRHNVKDLVMNAIPFKVIRLNVERFELKDVPTSFEGNVDVNTNFSFGVNSVSQLVRCMIDYSYIYKSERVLNMVFTCVFKIEADAFGTMMQEDKFVIEPFFSRYLATINVGAARGEIHARCELQKNDLSKIVLPPINLVEALPDPIVIDLK